MGSATSVPTAGILNCKIESADFDEKQVTCLTTDKVAALSREKKKKSTGFATLRRKFIRRRRCSKSLDHGKIFREWVSDWSTLELTALVEQYEASAALKDLSMQADLARPPAATFRQDLSDLYDYKYCTDVTLTFQGACFPAHRAILCARCPYFRDKLSHPNHRRQVSMDSLASRGLDVPLFAALLRYLYSGEWGWGENGRLDMLYRLKEEFGTPNLLEHDLRYLLDSGDMADMVLVFGSGQESSPDSQDSNGSDESAETRQSEYGFHAWVDIPCHRAILCARSPFLRSLIQRKHTTEGETGHEKGLMRIVMDESVIPKRYARLLMQAIYLDVVDIKMIQRGIALASEDGTTGPNTLLDEIVELYQIGRFLELDILAQSCEDFLVEQLTLEGLPRLLRWSHLPHGSPWVNRQARQLLREEFGQIATSSVLLELEKAHFIDALQSDFLQASELEILQTVLKWGENQLLERMEDREPNLVSQTAHSISRKGVRRRDLNDGELREILSDLLPYVRLEHIIPPNNETLQNAIRRGLVASPPSSMLGEDRGLVRSNTWIRYNANELHTKPRLFMPYYEEAKSLLRERLTHEPELVRMRVMKMSSRIPDALYMLEETCYASRRNNLPVPATEVSAADLPMPDPETLEAMLRREKKLKSSAVTLRAYELPMASKSDISKQIRLRVVREFHLPDSMIAVLEAANYRCEEQEMAAARPVEDMPPVSLSEKTGCVSVRGRSSFSKGSKHPAHACSSLCLDSESYLAGLLSPASPESASDPMPDIAIATGMFPPTIVEQPSTSHTESSLASPLHSYPSREAIHELQLDLGDGGASFPSHRLHCRSMLPVILSDVPPHLTPSVHYRSSLYNPLPWRPAACVYTRREGAGPAPSLDTFDLASSSVNHDRDDLGLRLGGNERLMGQGTPDVTPRFRNFR